MLLLLISFILTAITGMYSFFFGVHLLDEGDTYGFFGIICGINCIYCAIRCLIYTI